MSQLHESQIKREQATEAVTLPLIKQSCHLHLISVVCLLLARSYLTAQNTILWKVSHPDKQTTSYLLGTYHQMGNSFIDRFPVINALLQSSDIAFFETADDNKHLIASMNQRKPTYHYRKALRKVDVKFLESYAANWQVPLSKLTPMELRIKLHQNYLKEVCGTVRPSDEWDHFDNYVLHLAKMHNLLIKGLETDSLQERLISQIDPEYDWSAARSDLKSVVRNIKKSTITDRCKLAESYMRFQLDYELDLDCVEDRLQLIERNDAWMPTILSHLETNDIFVVVGLFHLYRKCGLIAQLRANNFVVEPVHME